MLSVPCTCTMDMQNMPYHSTLLHSTNHYPLHSTLLHSILLTLLSPGISNAVGMAIAEKHLAATFNQNLYPVVDHYTYVICGDGCLQEGISSEASSLAGHLKLGKLIVCYDDNLITIDGDTSLSFTEDVNKRYEAYGWHVQTVSDVNDLASLRAAITAAKGETDKPSLIKIRTIIGHGSGKQGSHSVHGAPLGKGDLAGKHAYDTLIHYIHSHTLTYTRIHSHRCEGEVRVRPIGLLRSAGGCDVVLLGEGNSRIQGGERYDQCNVYIHYTYYTHYIHYTHYTTLYHTIHTIPHYTHYNRVGYHVRELHEGLP